VNSDKVVAQLGGAVAVYVNGVWVSSLPEVSPGEAYWIVNKHQTNPWSYTYVGVPTLPVVARDHEGVITSISGKNTSSKNSATRATTTVKTPLKSKKNTTTRSSN
jgi:hypothetical protein